MCSIEDTIADTNGGLRNKDEGGRTEIVSDLIDGGSLQQRELSGW